MMRHSIALLIFYSFLQAQTPRQATEQTEDWNVLSLDKQPLTAIKPLVGQTDDKPTFTRQLVQVQWREHDPIYLYVMLPKLAAKPPVILHLINYTTEADLFLNDDYCKLLTANGVAAVGFSSALSGHRYHDRPMSQWFVSELPEALGETVHDVQMVLNYLAARGDVDMERVGVEGDGSGGAIAILAATVDSRIRAIDLLDPWGDWPDWLAKSTVVPDEERANYLTPSFLDRVSALDPVKAFPKLRIPVRLQYLRNEGATPAAAIAKMRAAAPAQTLYVPQEQGLAEYRATKGAKFFDWLKHELAELRSTKP